MRINTKASIKLFVFVFTISIFFHFFSTQIVYAAPGDLDSTFGISGKVVANIGGDDYAHASALQSDGKVVTAGHCRIDTQSPFCLVRHNEDGSRDTSFGTSGVFILPEGHTAFDVTIQSDGKIVAVGKCFSVKFFCTVRLNTDGTLDSSFDGDGKAFTSVTDNSNHEAHTIAIGADGKILVAGGCYGFTNNFCLVRYNIDGSLDTTFNGDGSVFSIGTNSSDEAFAAVIQADGKALVGGLCYSSRNGDACIARYNTDGSLDTTFGNNGWVYTNLGLLDNQDRIIALDLQLDGKVIAAAQCVSGSTQTDFCMARYQTNGDLDTTFSVDGKLAVDNAGLADQLDAVDIDEVGKIVMTGGCRVLPSEQIEFCIVRVDPDGILDSSFGNNGIVVTSIGPSSDFTTSIKVQPDNKILVSGSCASDLGYDFCLARYLGGVANQPPVINPLSGAVVNEGGTYSESGSFTDTLSTSWSGTVDYGDGSGIQALPLSGTNFSLNHIYKDNGVYTVMVNIADDQGESDTKTATVNVNNVNPLVGLITTSVNPIQVNTAFTASATFTDQGILDTHTATWNWGDGSAVQNASLTESNGSGSVEGSHTYQAAGVYEITLSVTDKDGGEVNKVYQYQTVYDQSAGWASGSKEFISQQGAVVGSPNASGKVNFGFQVKYQQGDIVPSGNNVELSFPAGNIDFASTGYQWLVINGSKATLKASGTLNGVSGYTVLVSVADQSQEKQNGLVRFQIKDLSNNVVYDTQYGMPDNADPITAVTKGKIAVH